ncbi:hypothetical protein PFLUV_G00185110 [Perca fluviatilis]|uniref:Uncharacterized protein n=1 Tax=Perca fluviatilis TaxID=8168 RepID=A0A6A5F083_PERFL|nr:hypothetical protein PFLUV_G00185110 [Perca fluviatilis]
MQILPEGGGGGGAAGEKRRRRRSSSRRRREEEQETDSCTISKQRQGPSQGKLSQGAKLRKPFSTTFPVYTANWRSSVAFHLSISSSFRGFLAKQLGIDFLNDNNLSLTSFI